MLAPNFAGDPLHWNPDTPRRIGGRPTEFGRPTGYVDPTAYRGTAASESLPYALPEGVPNGQ